MLEALDSTARLLPVLAINYVTCLGKPHGQRVEHFWLVQPFRSHSYNKLLPCTAF